MALKRLSSITDFYYYKKIKQKRRKDRERYEGDPFWELRRDILRYYKTQNVDDKELKEAIQYIKKEGVAVFPYPFNDKYDLRDIAVYTDEESDLKYVEHNGHNLYYPIEKSDKDIRKIHTNLLIEQDALSPHCYLSDDFQVGSNDVVLDVGAAEGILSLSIVEKVHQLVLFEVEEQWIKALQKTFEPWKDKVRIINKYVSDEDGAQTITIDSLLDTFTTQSVFLKLDVEGAEKKALTGAQRLLTSDEYRCKAAVCTYHNQNDHMELSAQMEDLGYQIETTGGYMLFVHDENLSAPYFRRALIRCNR